MNIHEYTYLAFGCVLTFVQSIGNAARIGFDVYITLTSKRNRLQKKAMTNGSSLKSPLIETTD